MPLQSPADAAELLYGQIPHALTSAQLEEYGIEAEPDQVRQFTREILSLNLYWMWSALDSVMTVKRRDRVFAELLQRIRAGWESELDLPGHEVDRYADQVKERVATYMRAMEDDGTPVGVLSETARILSWGGVVRPEDHQKILAFLLDLVPVDEIGEAVGDLNLAEV